jgi:hypothetical protein
LPKVTAAVSAVGCIGLFGTPVEESFQLPQFLFFGLNAFDLFSVGENVVDWSWHCEW